MKKNPFFNAVAKVNDFLGGIERIFSVVVLLALIVACMIFIICRFILHISTPWADESSRFVLIALGWIGASYCAYHDDHLRINALSGIVKKNFKNSARILMVVETVTQFLIGCFMIFFLTNFMRYLTGTVIPLGVLSSALQIPNYYPMFSVVIGATLMTIHSFLKTIICIGKLANALPFDEEPASDLLEVE